MRVTGTSCTHTREEEVAAAVVDALVAADDDASSISKERQGEECLRVNLCGRVNMEEENNSHNNSTVLT
jgi:hypothetical protein